MMEGSRSATVIFTIVDSQVQVKCENDQLAGMREWICIKRQQIEAYHGKANAVPSPWTRWAKRRENNAKTGRKSINCVLHGHQRLLSEPESIIRITMVLISRINQLQINLLIHVPGAVRRLTFVSTSFPRCFHVVSTLVPREQSVSDCPFLSILTLPHSVFDLCFTALVGGVYISGLDVSLLYFSLTSFYYNLHLLFHIFFLLDAFF